MLEFTNCYYCNISTPSIKESKTLPIFLCLPAVIAVHKLEMFTNFFCFKAIDK